MRVAWGGGSCLFLALLVLGFLPAPGAHAVTISEFPLGATPTGITSGPDGNMYVTTSAPSILRVSPAGDVTARYPLTTGGAPAPGLPVFSGDALWFVMRRVDAQFVTTTSIARRAPDGNIAEFPIKTSTAAVGGLVAGPDDNVWFTESGAKSAVGRITSQGLVTEFPSPDGAPASVTTDAQGQLLVLVNGRVAQVSTSGVITPTPTTAASAWKISGSTRTPTLWMAGTQGLCCYGAPSIDFAMWSLPGGLPTRVTTGFLGAGAKLKDLTVGPDGNAWVTDGTGPRVGRISTSGRVTPFEQGMAAGATPLAITPGPGDTVWFTDGGDRIGRAQLDRPTITTEAASGPTETGTSVGAVITPRGVLSRMRFEYGRTTAYGSATPWQDVEDVDDEVERAARLSDLAPGTTYHYRAVVSSALGTDPGPDRTVATVAPPPPPPPPPTDEDGDGYSVKVDCNDHAKSIHPGAKDVPGDGVDQDCVRGDQPFPRFYPHIVAYFKFGKRSSQFTSLTLDAMPAHAAVQLRCSGPGCRFDRWRTTLPGSRRRLNLLPRLAGSKLAHGAVLELRLTLPRHVGTVVRWKVGPPPRPVVTCLAPGKDRDQRC